GAAISTVISRFTCLLLFFWLLYRVTEVRVEFKFYLQFTKNYVAKILKIGIPSAVEQIMYHSCQLVFLFYATFLGAEALASRQYASNISSYIYLFSMAIGMGTAIMVGRFVGAKDHESAYQRVWKSVKWAMIATIAVDLVVITFRVPLVGIFTDNPEVIRIAAQVILLSIVLE
ncbi:MATE family efflux transporter, partial [Escherichia coli]|nr:MATE family efflux transporter [Escherichia coli]